MIRSRLPAPSRPAAASDPRRLVVAAETTGAALLEGRAPAVAAFLEVPDLAARRSRNGRAAAARATW